MPSLTLSHYSQSGGHSMRPLLRGGRLGPPLEQSPVFGLLPSGNTGPGRAGVLFWMPAMLGCYVKVPAILGCLLWVYVSECCYGAFSMLGYCYIKAPATLGVLLFWGSCYIRVFYVESPGCLGYCIQPGRKDLCVEVSVS